MTRHDLSHLSPIDFEDLCRDLLAAEWNRPIEVFRGGRDGGIDLRCSSLDDGIIIQCKHFVRSGFAKLRNHLVQSELPKIRRLDPGRYIITTSVPMSPTNKEAIKEALHPYVRSTDDIIASDDIAALLRSHPSVERSHYKLWLTSTAVLERVLHAAEHCQTEFAVERIQRKLPLFVQTPTYVEAVRRLDEHGILVITGPPGVGKTTLAEMLLFEHMSRNYEPVVIQSDIGEGRKLYKKAQHQIFYYDDFLGQTFYGEGGARTNHDAALRDFIEAVSASKTSRFVLTTRDHILSAALQRSERLQHSNLDRLKHVIDIQDYSFAHRAHILFNHLYFSSLPQAHIDALVEADAPVAVARHPDFNPRLIEWLSSSERMAHVEADAYPEHVRKLLESPEIIWQHAFEHEISFAAVSIVLTVYSLGPNPFRETVEEVWEALHQLRSERYNVAFAPNAFRLALKELEGAFLQLGDDRVAFINPSLRDYVADAIANSRDHARDILRSAIRARQFVTLRDLAKETQIGALQKIIDAEVHGFVTRIDTWWDRSEMLWRREAGGHYGYYVDLPRLLRLELLVELADPYQSEPIALEAVMRVDGVLAKLHASNDAPSVLRLISDTHKRSWFMKTSGDAFLETLKTFALSALKHEGAGALLFLSRSLAEAPSAWSAEEHASIQDAQRDYMSTGAADEINQTNNLEDLETLQMRLGMMSKEFGLELAPQRRALEQKIEEKEAEREPERESDDDYDREAPPAEQITSDDDVRDLFSCLTN